MTSRYNQTKQEAARHSELLRAMLKLPENKLCADCKRNDPRWASTNLGCFMCIRCSGIHRGMGVHITRIKSIDLDTWAPEQVANVQRWGNRRANAYWEAHLKAGHAPPEHKMESFIRSKYESRRWAMEGPLPEPESLDGPDDVHSVSAPTPTAPPPRSSASISTSTSTRTASSPIDLLAGPPSSTSNNQRSQIAPPSLTSSKQPPAPTPVAPKSNGGGLFDLDFNAPPPVPAARKDAKADILSLFSSAPTSHSYPAQNQQQPSSISGFGGLSLSGESSGNGGGWGTMGGDAGGGGFGAFESFDSVPAKPSVPSKNFSSSPPPPSNPSYASPNLNTDPWGSKAGQNDLFGDLAGGMGAGMSSKVQKDDAFTDIWK